MEEFEYRSGVLLFVLKKKNTLAVVLIVERSEKGDRRALGKPVRRETRQEGYWG